MKPIKDPLYYPRQELAATLLSSLNSGITNAFTLFAPRRMGKTQFLTNDITPKATDSGFNVFYFSFMDTNTQNNTAQHFHQSLYAFAKQIDGSNSVKTFFSNIKKIDVLGISAEREPAANQTVASISEIISYIANDNRPTLLLLDEAQELARIPKAENIIKSLRTGLDINQAQVKSIFTGSSTNGLRAMFNDIKAPFFQFAHALDFPTLSKNFTDFLAKIYTERTGKTLDTNELYNIFERLHKTPMYMRALIQDMIINPELDLNTAAQNRLAQMHDNANYIQQWQELSTLARFILQRIAKEQTSPYSIEFRRTAAAQLGVEEIKISTIQSTIRKLKRKELITQSSNNTLTINSPLLQTWITENSG